MDYCCFTGSIGAGRKIEQAMAGSFKGLTLELGGKDPAYVCADADFNSTVENLVDGAFFNSGQSCCGIERIYVEQNIYKPFVEAYVEQVKAYRLGNPLDRNTNLGPVVKNSAAAWIREQTQEAIQQGAKTCIDTTSFTADIGSTAYLAPQVLIDVNHNMRAMTEETFGPVVGIMPVTSDADAINKMNDSDVGLTASIWTQDLARAELIGQTIETGTVFMNRCDYLDPALVWTGVKNTGKGGSLSPLSYGAFTQAKSFHLKMG
jgi:acyl-CoA reductase-like NAD-dependent aldehyde dehydrogenase